MPSRTREHQLETLSRTAFRELCDAEGWVTRDVDSEGDYGIDLEVEIFEYGRTTGLTFRVQIKGSDTDPSGKKTRAIRIDTLDYWRSFDVPVLFVLFTAKDGILYGKWAHAHDIGRHATDEQKTTSFSFTEELIISGQASRLERDVRLIRAYKDRSIGLPLRVEASWDETSEHDSRDRSPMTRADARLALRSLSKVTAGTLSLSRESDQPQILVEQDRTGLRTRLMPDVSTLTIHGYRSDPSALLEDVILSVAILLHNVGWNTEAALLLRSVAPKRISGAPLEVIVSVATVLFQADRHSELLDILIPTTHSPEAERRNLGGALIATELDVLNRLSKRDQQRSTKALAALGRKEKSLKNNRESAQHFYNAGQMLRSLRHLREAAKMYDHALESDAEYGERAYFWSERAGLHWEVGRFRDAVSGYKMALELQADPEEVEPLLVESHLFAGDYAEGLALATRLVSSDKSAHPLALVSQITLRTIPKVTSLEQQEPRVFSRTKARELLNATDRDTVIDEMIRVNATEGFLWSRLLDVDPEAASADEMVSTAHLNFDARYWVLAAAAVIECGYPGQIIEAVIAMGLTWPDHYLQAFHQMSRLMDPAARASLQREITGFADKTPAEVEAVTVRMHVKW